MRLHSDELGVHTIALALLITTFFYCLPLGRYSVAGIGTDFRIYDFAIVGFFFFSGPQYLPKVRALFRDRSGCYYWAGLLLIFVWASLIITLLFGGFFVFLPAVIRALRFTSYIIISAFVVAIVNTPGRLRLILMVFYLNIALQAIIVLGQKINLIPNLWPSYWWQFGGAMVGTLSPHHLQISTVMMIGISISLTLLRSLGNPISKIAVGFLFAIMVTVIIFTGTRTIWVAVIVLFGCYPLLYRTKGISSIIILLLSSFLFYYLFGDSITDPIEETYETRLAEQVADTPWESAEQLSSGRMDILLHKIPKAFAEYPWIIITGSGFENASKALRGAVAAHNNYLNVLIELGVFGLVIYIIFLFRILNSLNKVTKYSNAKLDKLLSQDVYILFIAIMISMMASETLWAQYSMFTLTGQIMVIVGLGMCPVNWQKINF